MNILFISHLFPNKYEENSGIFNLNRIKALAKRGHKVKIIIPVSIFPPVKYIFPRLNIRMIRKYYSGISTAAYPEAEGCTDISFIPWMPLPSKYLWAYQNIPLSIFLNKMLKSAFTEFNPDLILLSVLNPEGAYSKYIKRMTDTPVFAIAEGSEILVNPQVYNGIEKICQIINKHTDKVIFVSETMLKSAEKLFPFTNYEILVNGYDQECFFYSGKNNIVKKECTIISAGNLEYIKGQDILIEAAKNIEGIRVIIAGQGFLYEEYNQLIKNQDLDKKIILAGQLTPVELKKYLDEADLFCLPSRSEGFGIAAIEAMACGLPVIAPRVGEMPCVIEEGVTGILMNDLNKASLIAAIQRAREINWDRELISRRVSQRYNWNFWAKKIEDLTESIKSQKKRTQVPHSRKGDN